MTDETDIEKLDDFIRFKANLGVKKELLPPLELQIQMQRNEAERDSEDEIDMSKVGFRQTDGDEERVIDSYATILEEIDKVTYSKPNHG